MAYMLSPLTVVAIILVLIVTPTPTLVECYPTLKKSLCFTDNISADCNEAFKTKILGTGKYRDLDDCCPELLNVSRNSFMASAECLLKTPTPDMPWPKKLSLEVSLQLWKDCTSQ
uniref:Putative ovule protein n=1 Tax=Solanum chacoense TaxID=4108 RepID=A0A0V0IH26_SOLCH